MFKVINREMIVPNLHLLSVEAPAIAELIKPGQFVIVRPHQDGERIPLSVADWDIESGVLTMVFMEVGKSTGKLAALQSGESVPTVVGPLGKPTTIDHFGNVVCVGGCYGIGSIFPVIKALKEKENRIHAFLEARSSYLLYWLDKLSHHCDSVTVITRDGSKGYQGHVRNIADILLEKKVKPDRVIANGCTFMIYKTAKELTHLDVPVIVSLNPIMIDGTGMCGVCRVTVEDRMKFACVDGPDFDGRFVDWNELLKRRKQYMNEEAYLVHDSGCGGA